MVYCEQKRRLEDNNMLDFLTNLIPVSIGIWVFLFILPGILSFIFQLWLCGTAVEFVFKIIPILIAAILTVLVVLCATTGFLSFLIGGFVSLVLIGTALFIAGASLIGWVIYGIVKMIA